MGGEIYQKRELHQRLKLGRREYSEKRDCKILVITTAENFKNL